MKRALLFLCVVTGLAANAHPVAFKDAWVFSAMNQPDMLDWQLLYTFERNLSLGVEYERDTMQGPERQFLIPRLSWLVRRWNGTDFQGNIYVYGGVGIARSQGKQSLAGLAAAEADYETRSFYTSAKASVIGAEGFDTLAMYQGRIGLAPYEGNFDEIQSWLVAQAQYFPFSREEPWRVGPLLRLFYRNVLAEVGVSAKSTWSFNLMVHW